MPNLPLGCWRRKKTGSPDWRRGLASGPASAPRRAMSLFGLAHEPGRQPAQKDGHERDRYVMRFGGREAVRELSGAALARLKPDSQWLVDPHLARCPLPIPGTVGSPYLARSRHRHIVARGWDGLMIRWSNLPMGGGESSVVCRLGILWGESSLSRQPSLAACLIERVFAVEGRSCSFPGTLVRSTNAPSALTQLVSKHHVFEDERHTTTQPTH